MLRYSVLYICLSPSPLHQVRATGCSAEVVGWARTEDGKECRMDQSGLPDTQCHFYPAHNNTARGSLMGLYHLHSVSQKVLGDVVLKGVAESLRLFKGNTDLN